MMIDSENPKRVEPSFILELGSKQVDSDNN